jgi:hypothetical protein
VACSSARAARSASGGARGPDAPRAATAACAAEAKPEGLGQSRRRASAEASDAPAGQDEATPVAREAASPRSARAALAVEALEAAKRAPRRAACHMVRCRRTDRSGRYSNTRFELVSRFDTIF